MRDERPRYAAHELRMIRQCAHERTDAEIAFALGRPVSGVSVQRRRMGILRGDHARLRALEAAFIELLVRVQELEAKRPRYPSSPQAIVHDASGGRPV